MNPIVKQVFWIAVFFIGLSLQGIPELFRKNEKAYKIMGTWIRNLGILIFIVPIMLAPFDAQPRVEGILGCSFRIVGIILAALGTVLIAISSKHLLKVAGPEQIPRELITNGVYSKVRNPIYTGVVLLTMGWSLVWRAIYSFFIITGMVILILLALIKFVEEPMLARLFGDEFLEYRKRVPMLFPLPIMVVIIALVITVMASVATGLISLTYSCLERCACYFI